MSDLFATIFSPIVYPMEILFNLFWSVTSSAGLAIIMLALVISILTIPLKTWASKVEDKIVALKALVDAEVADQADGLKGEERFEVIESVYERHGYHPIKSIITSASFVVVLPFLISAIFIFGNSASLKGVSFLFIDDLSIQDRVLFGLNFLPILMLLLGISEAMIRWRTQREQLIRYLIISSILFVLVYTLPSALIIYWISMNVCSTILHFSSKFKD